MTMKFSLYFNLPYFHRFHRFLLLFFLDFFSMPFGIFLLCAYVHVFSVWNSIRSKLFHFTRFFSFFFFSLFLYCASFYITKNMNVIIYGVGRVRCVYYYYYLFFFFFWQTALIFVPAMWMICELNKFFTFCRVAEVHIQVKNRRQERHDQFKWSSICMVICFFFT